MIETHLEIRSATDPDSDAVTRAFDVANPAWATSASHHRRHGGRQTAPLNGIVLVAERHGQIIGAARASEALEGLLPQPGNFSARVAVDPSAAGNGIGGHLWRAVAEWIERQSPRRISSWIDRDDQRSLAITTRWGFHRRPGSIEDPDDLADNEPWAWDYELNLTKHRPSLETAPPLPVGIIVSPLTEVLDDPRLLASLHEVHEECRADVPAWEPYEPKPRNEFEQTQRDRIRDGGTGLVAHRHREILAATFAERAAFVPVVHNDFTMVRRSARGQHLALGLKSRLLHELAERATEAVITEVRTDNAPMLAVNAALGFRRIAMRHVTRSSPLA